MSKDKKLYTEDSIESLSPLEFTRLRPGVYAGDTTYSTQLLVEIVSNAVDEFRLGHGNVIDVEITNNDKDAMIRVRDYGQGFLVNSLREDGKTVLEAAFSVLNTSGKYREDGTYEGTSLGSFGIGSKITTFLSNSLTVSTSRDGKFEEIDFKEGVFENRRVGTSSDLTGTLVVWKPSKEFFTNTGVEVKRIKELFKTITCLCPGLTINLLIEKEATTFTSKNGLNDLVDDYVGDKEIINNRFIMNYEEGKNKLDMVITYSSNYSLNLIPYVNTGLTEKGPHITQTKTIITREFNKFFKEKKWLKDKEENLSGDDIQEGMYIVFNITAPNIAYDAQVKSTVTKIDMQPFTQAIAEHLQHWFVNNEKDVKTIADKAISARKAREAAKKAREATRNLKTDSKSKVLSLPTKLVDAWGKDRSVCELFITEGDSAASGIIGARDGEIQAVFPIRGKIISVLKQNKEKVYANQEIVNIIKALGLDANKDGKLIYDKSKLRYGKIMLAMDADPDGKAIKNLLLTFFWWICPELITNGHIYATVPPLYRITTRKNEYIYLEDDVKLEEYKKAHEGEKYTINRNKGLGEQDTEELEECLVKPETRNILQILVDDVDKTDELFEILMGTKVVGRRDYLVNYLEEAKNE